MPPSIASLSGPTLISCRLGRRPFCNIDLGRIWLETRPPVAVPDAFPVAQGHMLVLPRKHAMTNYELSMPEQKAIWELVGRVRERLPAEHKPDGFNIGFNDGSAAGQTVLRVVFLTA